MLMGLTHGLTEGDMVPVTLIFEHAGKVEVHFMIDPAGAPMDPSTMDHSSMDHSNMGQSANP
jgi:hypothetical protein